MSRTSGRYEARWIEPLKLPYAGTPLPHARGDLGRAEVTTAPAAPQAPRAGGACPLFDALHALDALDGPAVGGDTTNLVTADGEGAACVLTTSLGLGTGDFLPELDLHLNSMLGEVDLVLAPLQPGERMASMMAPSLALAEDGIALAIRVGRRDTAADCPRRRGSRDPRRGLDPTAAVARPRFHRAGEVVNAEPGVDEDALFELEQAGLHVRRWAATHHYFGGVSLLAGRRSGRPAPQRPRRHAHVSRSFAIRRPASQAPTSPSAAR